MQVEVVDESSEETFITKITMINPSPDPIPLPYKYRCLFRGAFEMKYGRHLFRFPITHMGYKLLVSRFQSDFAGRVRVDFSSAGFDEV